MFRKSEPEVSRDEHALAPSQVELSPPPLAKGQAAPAAGLSILPKGAKLEGTWRTPTSLRIDGEFKGFIMTAGDAVLSPGSRVEADIQAQNVTVGGHHHGNLTVQNRATLGDAARVVGTISCRGLVINEGAWFDGKLSMGPPPDSLERPESKGTRSN